MGSFPLLRKWKIQSILKTLLETLVENPFFSFNYVGKFSTFD